MVRKLPKQIQSLIKYKVSSDVVKKQDELYEAVVEICRESGEKEKGISYKELNNDKISKVYNDFSLAYIINSMDNSECGYIEFSIINYHQIHPKRHYDCGFYYSEEDMPVDTLTGNYVESDTAVYETWPFYIHFWYRTEKITDNWWYYERWWMTMPTPHDSIIGNIIEGIIDDVFPPEFSE